VIENEFGEIDIDGSLVAAQANVEEDVLLLNNGCLCCTVRGDLVRMLGQLCRSKKAKFDHIVIETTGLANPAPIIQTFYLEPELQDLCRLDGVVTLVDAKHVELHLAEKREAGVVNEAMEQIAFADRIILNKTDLSTPPALRALEARLRGINGMAAIQLAQRGKVDIDYVLGVGGFDLQRVVDDTAFQLEPPKEAGHAHSHSHGHASAAEEAACTDPTHDHGHGRSHGPEACGECGESTADGHTHAHSHSHGHASAAEEAACTDPTHDHGHGHSHGAAAHTDPVGSVSLQLTGELDLDLVNDWLGDLLQERWQDLYRLKGVLAIQGFPERYVIQGVHSLFEGQVDRMWADGERRGSKIVFIGKDLDAKELRAGFESCVADPVTA
jgi:G3E family GTPase